jgi:hypothetical protein
LFESAGLVPAEQTNPIGGWLGLEFIEGLESGITGYLERRLERQTRYIILIVLLYIETKLKEG